MKYEKPIINITLSRKDNIILTSLINEGGDYTDPNFPNSTDVKM